MNQAEFESRRRKAIAALHAVLGTPAGDGNVNLFVDHHLDDLPADWWRQRLGAARPEPLAVLGLLECKASWSDDDLQVFDFTLPGGVAGYVVSVRFGADGAVERLAMER